MLVLRDCLRQTTLDYLQLSRALRIGVDLDGDRIVDLNPNGVGYIGHSLGGYYGSAFAALDPNVKTFVFNSSGGSLSNLLTNSADYKKFFRGALAARIPSLLNMPGDFNANMPLRNDPEPIVNTVPGAIEIQEFLSRLEWIETSGAPYSYAAHFSGATLPGVPSKKVLFQYASGDQTVPNPTEAQLVRAASMIGSTRFVRYDLLRQQVDPALPANPHLFMLGVVPSPLQRPLAGVTQIQGLTFLQSSGTAIANVDAMLGFPFTVFEARQQLPEDLNFLQ
jgi:pimeloyl-ACP methyl ester carboxylesterase